MALPPIDENPIDNIKRELERLQKTVFDLREDNIKLRQTLIDNDFIIGGDLVDRPGVNETAAKFLRNIKIVDSKMHKVAEDVAAKLVREIRGQKMTDKRFHEITEMLNDSEVQYTPEVLEGICRECLKEIKALKMVASAAFFTVGLEVYDFHRRDEK